MSSRRASSVKKNKKSGDKDDKSTKKRATTRDQKDVCSCNDGGPHKHECCADVQKVKQVIAGGEHFAEEATFSAPKIVGDQMSKLERIADKLLHTLVGPDATTVAAADALGQVGNMVVQESRAQFGILNAAMEAIADDDVQYAVAANTMVNKFVNYTGNVFHKIVEQLRAWGTTFAKFIIASPIFIVSVLGGILLLRRHLTDAVAPDFIHMYKDQKDTITQETVLRHIRASIWSCMQSSRFEHAWTSFAGFVAMLFRPLFEIPIVGPMLQASMDFVIGVITSIVKGVFMRIGSIASPIFDRILSLFIDIPQIVGYIKSDGLIDYYIEFNGNENTFVHRAKYMNGQTETIQQGRRDDSLLNKLKLFSF